MILTFPTVQAAIARRPERPLLVADLAVPRDADPLIASLPALRLVDVDGLEAQVLAHGLPAARVRAQVKAIVADEAAGFEAWYSAALSVPVIQALRERGEAIGQAGARARIETPR